MKPYIKDPDAVLDYQWDWTRWLDGDTIETHDILPVEGISVDRDTATDSTVTAWISGGAVGLLYAVTCRITTASGRTDDRTINIVIRPR